MLRSIKILLVWLLSGQFVYAGYIADPGTCDVTNASLTSIEKIIAPPLPSGVPSGINLLSTSYDATTCVCTGKIFLKVKKLGSSIWP